MEYNYPEPEPWDPNKQYQPPMPDPVQPYPQVAQTQPAQQYVAAAPALQPMPTPQQPIQVVQGQNYYYPQQIAPLNDGKKLSSASIALNSVCMGLSILSTLIFIIASVVDDEVETGCAAFTLTWLFAIVPYLGMRITAICLGVSANGKLKACQQYYGTLGPEKRRKQKTAQTAMMFIPLSALFLFIILCIYAAMLEL